MPDQTFVLVAEESHARPIHVLFTDIQMPGTMDGLALAHHTPKHWPWIGLLVTSGPAPVRRSSARGASGDWRCTPAEAPLPERVKPQLDCGRLATRYLRNDPVLTQHLRFHLED